MGGVGCGSGCRRKESVIGRTCAAWRGSVFGNADDGTWDAGAAPKTARSPAPGAEEAAGWVFAPRLEAGPNGMPDPPVRHGGL